MGTRSKVDVNHRCTVRGGPGTFEIEDALYTLENAKRFNRAARRRAFAIVRKAAKRIKKRVPRDQRKDWQKGIVAITEAV